VNTFDKNAIQAVALDLDGTLLNHGKLHPEAAETLSSVAARGIHIIPATGRNRSMFPAGLLQVPELRYAVTLNGATVSDLRENTYIARTTLPLPLIEALTAYAEGRIKYTHFMTDDTVTLTEKALQRTRAHLLHHFSAETLQKIFLPVEDPLAHIKSHEVCVNKLVFTCADATLAQQLLPELSDKFNVETAIMEGRNIEVTQQGTNKAQGLSKLAEHLGFSLSNTIAIGDSGNDVQMLQSVGHPIAMGNAPSEIQRLAWKVAPPVSEMGAAKILQELLLS